MLSSVIKWLFKSVLGKNQSRVLLVISEIFSISLTLYLFKMTSALVPVEKLQHSSNNYFEFLLIGEIALLLPLSYFENSIRIFTTFMSSGFIHTLKSNQINPYRVTTKLAQNDMWRPALRLMFILIGGVFLLETSLTPSFYINFILSQVLTVIAIVILSELVMSIYECYQRGLKIFYSLNSILAILGGAYFPVTYLSPFIKEYAVWLFPQTIALQLARLGLQSSPMDLGLRYLYYLIYIVLLKLIVGNINKHLRNKIISKRLSHLVFS